MKPAQLVVLCICVGMFVASAVLVWTSDDLHHWTVNNRGTHTRVSCSTHGFVVEGEHIPQPLYVPHEEAVEVLFRSDGSVPVDASAEAAYIAMVERVEPTALLYRIVVAACVVLALALLVLRNLAMRRRMWLLVGVAVLALGTSMYFGHVVEGITDPPAYTVDKSTLGAGMPTIAARIGWIAVMALAISSLFDRRGPAGKITNDD